MRMTTTMFDYSNNLYACLIQILFTRKSVCRSSIFGYNVLCVCLRAGSIKERFLDLVASVWT